MRVISNFFYYGPNRRTDKPVIEQLIQFEPAGLKLIGNKASSLESRLVKLLRDNRILAESENFPFTALAQEPKEWFCALYAQLALLFQQKCDHDVTFFSAMPVRDENRYICLIEYEHIDVGLSAAKLARKVITLKIKDFRKSFETLRNFSAPRVLPGDTRAIIKAAAHLEIPVTKLERWPFDTDWNTDFEKPEPIRPNSQLLLGQCRHQQIVDGTYCRTKAKTPVDFGKDRRKISRLLNKLEIPQARPANQDSDTDSEYRIIIGNGTVIAVVRKGEFPEAGVDRTGITHDSILEQALSVYRAIDSALLVIDIRTSDLSQPFSSSGGGVGSLDVAPKLDHFLSHDSPILASAAKQFLGWLYPEGKPAKVPVIAITGTNGKTTTSRMIDRILRVAGFETGLVCTDGVYIGQQAVFDKDQAQAYGHLKVLTSPSLDAAVLECQHAGIATTGFAFKWCDVAVCTNVSDDHMHELGVESVSDMAVLKRSLASRLSSKLTRDMMLLRP